MFKEDKPLKNMHDDLIEFITKDSWITLRNNQLPEIVISENGSACFWFDDLVVAVLRKAADGDPEIIKICANKGIELYETTLKTRK